MFSGGFALSLVLLPRGWDLLEWPHGHKSPFMCFGIRMTTECLHGWVQQCVGARLLVKLGTMWWDRELWEKPISTNLSTFSTSLSYMKSHILWALPPHPTMVQSSFLAASSLLQWGTSWWGGKGECLPPSVFPGWVAAPQLAASWQGHCHPHPHHGVPCRPCGSTNDCTASAQDSPCVTHITMSFVTTAAVWLLISHWL